MNQGYKKAERNLGGIWSYSYQPHNISVDDITVFLSDKPEFPYGVIPENIQYDLYFFPDKKSIREEITIKEWKSDRTYTHENYYTYEVANCSGNGYIPDHLVIWVAPKGEKPDTNEDCTYRVNYSDGVPTRIVTDRVMPFTLDYGYFYR